MVSNKKQFEAPLVRYGEEKPLMEFIDKTGKNEVIIYFLGGKHTDGLETYDIMISSPSHGTSTLDVKEDFEEAVKSYMEYVQKYVNSELKSLLGIEGKIS